MSRPRTRRQKLLVLAASGSIFFGSAFCPAGHSSRRNPVQGRRERTLILRNAVLNKTIGSESNFWFSVTREEDDETNEKPGPGFRPKWPIVPSLDANGPLPPKCYKYFGRDEFQPKPTCALVIAVSMKNLGSEDAMDADHIVQGMQQFVDNGLSTFHLGLPPPPRKRRVQPNAIRAEMDDLWLPSSYQAWGESQIYGKLLRSTPASVLKSCNLVSPLMTPPAETHSGNVDRILVREAVTQTLGRIGTDSIDTLELQYCDGSPYHFDMMDCLVDLQRDGLIKSISGRGFPTQALRGLEGCGFHLDSHHRSFNLLSPDTSLGEYQLAASDLATPNVFSQPLAGGLLTDRFEDRVFPPLSSEAGGVAELKQITGALQSWAQRRQQREAQSTGASDPVHYLLAWKQYQEVLLPQLRELSRKYRVSIAAVALRFILQMDQSGGTIVGCNMMKDADNKGACLSSRIKGLRDTFRFELDEEDLELLRDVTGVQDRGGFSGDHGEEMDDGFDLGGAMNNPKLWL